MFGLFDRPSIKVKKKRENEKKSLLLNELFFFFFEILKRLDSFGFYGLLPFL